MRAVLTGLLFLACVGCAERTWVNPGKTERQFYGDRARCRVQAQQAAPRNDLFSADLYRQTFVDCMYGEGWTVVER